MRTITWRSLAAAHASIAPGTALYAARNAADVVLLSGGLKGVSITLRMARLATSVWTIRSSQYDDPAGDQARALSDQHDDRPL
ncbi:Cytochrome oxidase maturation protein cbb3-type [Rhodobacteraceae bacterium THAF1]|uniref:cbb3-type cytochrome oxidase assembly protein CcoS n=1 Tax=Palleronia sp. THAF1 TaxID=2587842 RepID=UPI000F3EEDD2|nr:cbb3-type cytochrome oxidase assembly protein CcoS [Palleronia sp. THAF1]QFU08153.1 Cytochrome oxidase maturation protein cbb3-type [Palleronia sp. THAF1]VDC28704.1 Cytochrome oxidase maturation protein cbb3-type [Rhodobacteraceae bacterium THAF1]